MNADLKKTQGVVRQKQVRSLPEGCIARLYAEGGHEYFVIVAGGHHFMETPEGDYMIAYALLGAGGSPPR